MNLNYDKRVCIDFSLGIDCRMIAERSDSAQIQCEKYGIYEYSKLNLMNS